MYKVVTACAGVILIASCANTTRNPGRHVSYVSPATAQAPKVKVEKAPKDIDWQFNAKSIPQNVRYASVTSASWN